MWITPAKGRFEASPAALIHICQERCFGGCGKSSGCREWLWGIRAARHMGPKKNILNSLFSTKMSEIPPLRGGECFWLVDGKPFHKPAVFLAGEGADFGCGPGPLEAARVQPHVEQDKTCFIMMQGFQTVRFPAAEKIKCICIRIHLVSIPDDRHKAIDGEPHIRTAALPSYKSNAAYSHDIFILIFLRNSVLARFFREKMRITF